MAQLTAANGRVVSVDAQRYGVHFRLSGWAETFSYPSKAGAYGAVESALAAAGDRPVSVWFDPHPRTPWFGAPAHYDVWQLAVGGHPVRTMAQAREGWRSDNLVAAWLFPCFLLPAICCTVLAWRAWRSRRRFDDRPWIDLA